jgi:hypothetical protein
MKYKTYHDMRQKKSRDLYPTMGNAYGICMKIALTRGIARNPRKAVGYRREQQPFASPAYSLQPFVCNYRDLWLSDFLFFVAETKF